MDSSVSHDVDLSNQHHSLTSSVSSEDLNASVYDDEFSEIAPEELSLSGTATYITNHNSGYSGKNAVSLNYQHQADFQDIKVV